MKTWKLACLLLVHSSVSAQVVEINSPAQRVACSYYGEEISTTITSFKSNDQAREFIENIASIVGLKPNFEIRIADIPNAAAVIYRSKRWILYNPGFTARLNKVTGSNWASISILAHEVGHHLNGHTLLSSGSRPEIELEADEFSGFILRKMGAGLSDAQAAMRIASGVNASHTHPGRSDRLKAIAAGWSTADNQLAVQPVVPKTNPSIEKPVITEKKVSEPDALLAEKYIAYDVHFDADPSSKYYVTIRNNLVKVDEENIYVAGTLAKSNKKKYAAMFYDKHYNYLYITSTGIIINGASKRVGVIKGHVRKSDFL